MILSLSKLEHFSVYVNNYFLFWTRDWYFMSTRFVFFSLTVTTIPPRSTLIFDLELLALDWMIIISQTVRRNITFVHLSVLFLKLSIIQIITVVQYDDRSLISSIHPLCNSIREFHRIKCILLHVMNVWLTERPAFVYKACKLMQFFSYVVWYARCQSV